MDSNSTTSSLITFTHASDEFRQFFTSKETIRPTFYWFTDRYHDHISSWKFAAYKYFYLFLSNPVRDKVEFRSRHEGGGFDGLYRHYQSYENWAKRKEMGLPNKFAFEEPGIIYSFSYITPMLISFYDESKKDFVVISPVWHQGMPLDLFYPNGLSKNFLKTRLAEIFPPLKDSIPFAKVPETNGSYNYSGWIPMPGRSGYWI